MKKKLLAMLKAKTDKRAQLLTTMAETEDKEVRSSQLELMGSLDAEIAELNDMIERCEDEPEDAEKRAQGIDPELQQRAQGIPAGQLRGLNGSADSKDAEIEQRGAELKAGKAVTVRAQTIASGLIVEKKYSRDINDKFNDVSSLIDRVNAVPLQGGESYTKGFAVSATDGDYTAEGAAASEVTVTFDYIDIAKSKITAYAEVTEEVKKLPNVDYANYIQGEITKAIRRKITKQIISGAGTTNTLCGIYNAPTKVMPTASDISITAIDEDTLNTIVFAYGGDEDVMENGVLVLSKVDLKAFADVRGTDLKPVYKITKQGNTGVIEYAEGGVSVDYIINSACNALSTASTAINTMVYGNLAAYELPVFSDVEIKEDTSYKFKEGMIAYRGNVFVGGNVAMYKGWMRIKKQIAG